MRRNYTISEVMLDDTCVQVLETLHAETFPQDDPPEWHGSWWWLAYTPSGVPVAFAGLQPSQRFSGAGYLCRAGVLEAHQGHGLQRRLIHARVAKARRFGWSHVFSDTHQNPASANNLIRCGFQTYEPKHPYGFDRAIYWYKRLP